MRDIHLRQFPEQQFRPELRGRAVAGGRVRHLAAARERQQFRQGVRLDVRMHVQEVGRECGHRNRLQIVQRVVARVGEHARIDAVGNTVDQDRVAICRGVHDRGGGDVSACARPVLDHDGLPQGCGKLLPDQAGNDIGRTAGGKRHDEPDRLFGKRGVRRKRDSQCCKQRDRCAGEAEHGRSPDFK